MKKLLLLVVFSLFIAGSIAAAQPTKLAVYGITEGMADGNIGIKVSTTESCVANIIFDYNYVGALQDSDFNITLGNTIDLNLNYNQDYYLCVYVNGNLTLSAMNFRGGQGQILDVNATSDSNFAGLQAGNIFTAGTVFADTIDFGTNTITDFQITGSWICGSFLFEDEISILFGTDEDAAMFWDSGNDWLTIAANNINFGGSTLKTIGDANFANLEADNAYLTNLTAADANFTAMACSADANFADLEADNAYLTNLTAASANFALMACSADANFASLEADNIYSAGNATFAGDGTFTGNLITKGDLVQVAGKYVGLLPLDGSGDAYIQWLDGEIITVIGSNGYNIISMADGAPGEILYITAGRGRHEWFSYSTGGSGEGAFFFNDEGPAGNDKSFVIQVSAADKLIMNNAGDFDFKAGDLTTTGGVTAQNDSNFVNVGISGNLYVEGETSISATYIQASDASDQSFVATGTGYPIEMDTIDENYGIGIMQDANIYIETTGIYYIAAQPQVTASAGQSGNFHMWIQKDTGTGYADVDNSNIELSLSSQEEDVIPLIDIISLSQGDKIRMMASVSNTNITLDAQTPAGEPAIPSIIFTMYKIGT